MVKSEVIQKRPVILHFISNLSFGGAERLLTDMLLHAHNDAYHHVVAYLHDGHHRHQLEKAGITVYPLLGKIKTVFDPFILKRALSIIGECRPLCIQTWLWYAAVLGRICGAFTNIPVIETVHQNVMLDGPIRGCIDKMTRFLSHTVVAVSDDIAQSLKKREKKFKTMPIFIVKNGIAPLPHFDRESVRHKIRNTYKIRSNELLILAVGRFVSVKNFSLLLTVFRHFLLLGGHAKLVLVGSGPLENNLRMQVNELGITNAVIFTGACDAAEFFSAADIFVQTSLNEGISVALLQAMQQGVVPVVCGAHPFHPVIVDAKNGRVVNGSNSVGVATVLYELSLDSEQRSILSTAAQETVSSLFSLERMYTEYEKLYQNVILTNARPATMNPPKII